MSCEICLLDSTVDTVIWNCIGCSRTFHPACVGISVQRNSLRRKEKKIDIQSYVVACCSSCQNLVTMSFGFDTLIKQQAELADVINKNTEIVHRLNQKDKIGLVHETVDRVEGLLIDTKKELSNLNIRDLKEEVKAAAANAKNSALMDELAALKKNFKHEDVTIKNHLTTLFDYSMQATKQNIMEYVDALTTDLTTELKNICSEFEKVSTLIIDMAGHCSEHNASQPNLTSTVDIIDELKALSSAINLLEKKHATLSNIESLPSLEAEMCGKRASMESELNKKDTPELNETRKLIISSATGSSSTSAASAAPDDEEQNEHGSGWRFLDRWVYRPAHYWAEYDAKQLRRRIQQKAADKAKLKKRRNKRKNRQHNFNFDNNGRGYNDEQNPALFNRANIDRRSNYNYNDGSHGGTSFLPPDRVLLATAKERFSKPPSWPTHQASFAHRPIQFQRGETLNPYPADVVNPGGSYDRRTNLQAPGCSSFPAAPCEACQVPHSCFQRHRRTA